MRQKLSNRLTLCLSTMLLVLLGTTGCGLFGGSTETLTVLAGSELKDIQPLLDQIENNTDVRLEFTYIGTLNGTEELLSGADYDLAWFSHARYLSMLDSNNSLIATQEKIMLSPVVMGVKESKAREFGWIDNADITWQDVADKAASGELRFAMTNPAASNSGFTALVGVAAALADSSDALETGDINSQGMADFFKGQALTAGSSGWLAESYVEAQQDNLVVLDGMINYESVLLALNQGRELNEKFTIIYPKEGIITADYPLMLLDKDKREAYDLLVEYLRTPEMQQDLMETTLRRPAVAGISLDSRIPDSLLVELPFPNRVDVIDQLLFAYLDEQRIPAHAYFLLDVSGSMDGNGIRDLKTAINNLTGLDDSLTGRFARFRGREAVTIVTFNHEVTSVNTFSIDNTDAQGGDMQQIRDHVNGLFADGGTAIYSSLAEVYQLAANDQSIDPDRYYSIVLMSDGENTDGASLREFRQWHERLPAEVRRIRTFTVVFGNADEAAMEEIADSTGGRKFDGTSESLSLIFKQIRGYQ
ncbi:MAG: substrate-binding and VWA domain-containing protein [Chloroflexota bacterium]